MAFFAIDLARLSARVFSRRRSFRYAVAAASRADFERGNLARSVSSKYSCHGICGTNTGFCTILYPQFVACNRCGFRIYHATPTNSACSSRSRVLHVLQKR